MVRARRPHVDLVLGRPLEKLPSQYFVANFVITTSGVCLRAALIGAVLKIGVDSVLFAVDYPYESTADAVHSLDSAPLAVSDRAQIAHGNAERILHLAAAEAG
jgi:2,3-dihydroxybenzoate decarboxylase